MGKRSHREKAFSDFGYSEQGESCANGAASQIKIWFSPLPSHSRRSRMISSGLCLFSFIVRGPGYPAPPTPHEPALLAAVNRIHRKIGERKERMGKVLNYRILSFEFSGKGFYFFRVGIRDHPKIRTRSIMDGKHSQVVLR